MAAAPARATHETQVAALGVAGPEDGEALAADHVRRREAGDALHGRVPRQHALLGRHHEDAVRGVGDDVHQLRLLQRFEEDPVVLEHDVDLGRQSVQQRLLPPGDGLPSVHDQHTPHLVGPTDHLHV